MKIAARIALVFVLVLGTLQPAARAADAAVRIDYEDGSYAIITTWAGVSRGTTSDYKTYTYYDTSGKRCFTYTLCADFSYNGRTSSADSAYAKTDFYSRGWTVDSHSEYTSGSTAYGQAVFSGPSGTRNVSLTLTCDVNGRVA